MKYCLEKYIDEQRKVKLRRGTMTQHQKELSKQRLTELIGLCGGRIELAYMVNNEIRKTGYVDEQINEQDITNCVYRKKTTPQLAIRIDRTISNKKGFEKFTKEYLCPDLLDHQFQRVMRSMFVDKPKEAS